MAGRSDNSLAALLLAQRLVETDAPAMLPPPEQHPYSLPGLADGTMINHPANLIAAYDGLELDLHRTFVEGALGLTIPLEELFVGTATVSIDMMVRYRRHGPIASR